MDEELVSILLAPTVMLAAVVIGFGIVALVIFLRHRKRRARRRMELRLRNQEAQRDQGQDTQRSDPVTLKTYPMPVVDVSEARVFEQLDDIAERSVSGHRVLPQVSLSAFMYNGLKGQSRAEEVAAASLMSSRQVDFLVVDGDWHPVVAVSLERDALSAGDEDGVEANACASAGVPYLKASAKGLSQAQLDEIKRHVGDAQSIAAQ